MRTMRTRSTLGSTSTSTTRSELPVHRRRAGRPDACMPSPNWVASLSTQRRLWVGRRGGAPAGPPSRSTASRRPRRPRRPRRSQLTTATLDRMWLPDINGTPIHVTPSALGSYDDPDQRAADRRVDGGAPYRRLEPPHRSMELFHPPAAVADTVLEARVAAGRSRRRQELRAMAGWDDAGGAVGRRSSRPSELAPARLPSPTRRGAERTSMPPGRTFRQSATPRRPAGRC